MSDLHLEFQDNCRLVRDYDFPVTGDILVLAGDTMYLKDRTTEQLRSGSGRQQTSMMY